MSSGSLMSRQPFENKKFYSKVLESIQNKRSEKFAILNRRKHVILDSIINKRDIYIFIVL